MSQPVNMIIFYVIPIQQIKTNKRKLPTYSFKNPNISIIIIHFILHFLLILVGLFLILFSLENYDHINESRVQTGLIILCMITVFVWVVQIGINFSMNDFISSKMTVNEINSILIRKPPVDFIFIYSKDEITKTECSEECEEKTFICYSKTGVKIPVISEITSHIYNFSNVSLDFFYFNIEQDIDLTLLFSTYFMNILNTIKMCDSESKKVVEYYPLIKGTYAISNGKIPRSLSKTTRIVSIIFGVGVYYELYTKSIPFINFKQKLKVDSNNSINYEDIFNIDKCSEFGKCVIYNSKPIP